MNEPKLTILPRAMQTDRFTIIVGPNKSSYKVPEGRLTMHSTVFERMCSAPFLESTQRVINLPEEEPEVFDNFFDWIHSAKPQVDFSKGTEAVFNLAIFAEKYQICHLKNQLSDIIKKDWDRRKLKPETIDQVYRNVPDGAVLRQLCSLVLKRQVSSYSSFERHGDKYELYKEYAPVFNSHSDLGRDFFKWATCGDPETCAFHDHSNITNPVEAKNYLCPYSDIHFPAPESKATPEAGYQPSKKQKKNP